MFNRQNISKSTTEHQLIFWRRFFLAALILLLIPLAIISFYSHGMSDDFVWSTHQYRALQNGEGLIGFLKGCHEETHWNYFEHHGEFTAILLGVLNPLAFGDQWYWTTAFVMIGFLVFSMFCLWRHVADGSRQERVMADIAAAVSSIILVEFVPRAVDMFYWFDGAVNYLPYFGMLAIMSGMFLRLFRAGRLPKGQMIGLYVLTYFSMGGNTITMVVNCMAVVGWGLGLLLLYGRHPGERSTAHAHIWRYYGILMLSTALGVMTDLIAPGNQARFADESGNELTSVWEIITRTIDYAAASVRNQTTMMMLFLLALLIPIFWIWSLRILDSAREQGRRTAFELPTVPVVAYTFFLHCAGYAPTIWMYGTEGEYRMEDVRFFYLVFYLLVLEFYLVGKAAILYRDAVGVSTAADTNAPAETITNANAPAQTSVLTRFLIVDLTMILIFGTAYYVLPSSNRNSMSSLSATLSLLNGEARRYDAQVKAQQAILEDPATAGEDVVIYAVEDHPKVLYLPGGQINEDPTSWINQAVAAYYDKASVTLIPADETADDAADESVDED